MAGFAGTTSEVDLLRPVFKELDGIVVLTALRSSDDEMASLISEVRSDFCVGADRVVTSSVPALDAPRLPEPERTVPPEVNLVA